MKKLYDGLRHLPVVRPPEEVWTGIESALAQRAARPQRHIWRFAWAAAAAALIIAAAIFWPRAHTRQPAWQVERLTGSPSLGRTSLTGTGSLSVGQWLETDASSRAEIKVGDIGTLDVDPNTRLKLTVARPNEHRLTLAHGSISAVVNAPPRLFFVDTPASTAVDLGCAYKLNVDDSGFGLLRVTLGWVSLEWGGRESLVPAGASCRTRPKIGPGTPYFDDAPQALEQALERFDFSNGGGEALDAALAQARVRDTLSLWHLLSRADPAARARVADRIVDLAGPLPEGVTRQQILALDPAALESWRKDLAWKW